jgi:hypothetical protein
VITLPAENAAAYVALNMLQEPEEIVLLLAVGSVLQFETKL